MQHYPELTEDVLVKLLAELDGEIIPNSVVRCASFLAEPRACGY